MPAVQTTYNEKIVAARVGQIANTEPVVLISRTVEDETPIAFGKPVMQGTADDGCKLFAGASTEVLGITVRERSTRPETPDTFARYESARIMKKGVIWVVASVAVVAGDPVYVIPATAAFAKTNASSAILIPNARWDSSAGIGALAKVRLG